MEHTLEETIQCLDNLHHDAEDLGLSMNERGCLRDAVAYLKEIPDKKPVKKSSKKKT